MVIGWSSGSYRVTFFCCGRFYGRSSVRVGMQYHHCRVAEWLLWVVLATHTFKIEILLWLRASLPMMSLVCIINYRQQYQLQRQGYMKAQTIHWWRKLLIPSCLPPSVLHLMTHLTLGGARGANQVWHCTHARPEKRVKRGVFWQDGEWRVWRV